MRRAALALLLLAAPGVARAEAVPPELLGATWRWVGFVSPVESLAVPDPARYSLAFLPEGRLALQADCNRGMGGVSFPEPGALRLGAVALTRALCPEGSLADRYVRDLSRAARWFLREGALHLELPVDSGVLRFERAP